MSDVQNQIKEIVALLSPEAKELVKYVISQEADLRYEDRTRLPEKVALEALKIASQGVNE